MQNTVNARELQASYRVAIYTYDCGAFIRTCIQKDVTEEQICEINNTDRARRAVILAPDDPWAENLPPIVRGQSKMESLVAGAVARCSKAREVE